MIYCRVMPKRVFAALVCLAATLIAVSGCGDDDEEPGPTSPVATASEEPTPTPATASPTEEPFDGGRDPVVATPVPGGFLPGLLQSIEIEDLGTFDRITFVLEGRLPGYDVRYVEPPIAYDPRGDDMEIEGSAFILIRMEPAAGYNPDTGDPTYLGPMELKPGFPSLLEAERVGDFEGVLNWALGLTAEVDFRVTTLQDPLRLVVDVAHP